MAAARTILRRAASVEGSRFAYPAATAASAARPFECLRDVAQEPQPIDDEEQRRAEIIGRVDAWNRLQRQGDDGEARRCVDTPEQACQHVFQQVTARHSHDDNEQHHRKREQARDAERQNDQKMKQAFHAASGAAV